eukprot:EG_transcript_23227
MLGKILDKISLENFSTQFIPFKFRGPGRARISLKERKRKCLIFKLIGCQQPPPPQQNLDSSKHGRFQNMHLARNSNAMRLPRSIRPTSSDVAVFGGRSIIKLGNGEFWEIILECKGRIRWWRQTNNVRKKVRSQMGNNRKQAKGKNAAGRDIHLQREEGVWQI